MYQFERDEGMILITKSKHAFVMINHNTYDGPSSILNFRLLRGASKKEYRFHFYQILNFVSPGLPF